MARSFFLAERRVRHKNHCRELRQPIKWNREAEKNGQRAKVFCTCLHDDVRKGEYARLSTAIAATPHLDWLLLTGDRENLGPSPWQPMPKNVWRGVALHGDDAQELLSALKEYKAAVKFVWTSGAVPGAGDLNLSGIDWLLIDGQSGKSEAQLWSLIGLAL